jgi:hypothetical protein
MRCELHRDNLVNPHLVLKGYRQRVDNFRNLMAHASALRPYQGPVFQEYQLQLYFTPTWEPSWVPVYDL